MSCPLPNYIRTFRRKADRSQDELARLLGGSAGSTVLRHEDDQRVPTLETALRYAAIFQVDLRQLFAGRCEAEREVVRDKARELLSELTGVDHSAHKLAVLHTLVDDHDLYYEPWEAE